MFHYKFNIGQLVEYYYDLLDDMDGIPQNGSVGRVVDRDIDWTYPDNQPWGHGATIQVGCYWVRFFETGDVVECNEEELRRHVEDK